MRFLILLLAACVHLPHAESKRTDAKTMERANVDLYIECGDEARFANGVIISERHVLTAYHAVRCAEIPTVKMMYGNDQITRLVVTRESPTSDIAKLENFSAENFGMFIPPPSLKAVTSEDIFEPAYAFPDRLIYGRISSYQLVNDMDSVRGDSGSAVYDEFGNMLGLITKTGRYTNNDKRFTEFTYVDSTWLEGT